MVEGDAFGAAVFGQSVQDVALLAGREHALTVMDTIVGTLASVKREHSPLFHADG